MDVREMGFEEVKWFKQVVGTDQQQGQNLGSKTTENNYHLLKKGCIA